MKRRNSRNIVQGNGITYMTSDLSLVQLKVLMTIIRELQEPISMMISDMGHGHIKPDSILPEAEVFGEGDSLKMSRKITIGVKDIGLGSQNTRYLLSSLEALRDKTCIIPSNPTNPSRSQKVLVTGLITHYTYDRASQTVDVYLLDVIARKLLLVSDGFTRYDYTHAMDFENKYTVRMYWIINSWRGRKGFRISMDQLRFIMSAEDKYPRDDNFISKVIKVAYNELKETGDIWFEYSRDCREGHDNFAFKVYQRMAADQREKLLKRPKDVAYSKLYSIWQMPLKDCDHFVSLITVDNVQAFMKELKYLEQSVDRRQLNSPGAYMKTALTAFFSSLDEVSQEIGLPYSK